MLNLYQLQIFQTVAQVGSFSRAAEQLYLSQPAVSQHIQALETDLGARLFRRGRRGIKLTPAGEVLLDYAHNLLRLANRARQAITQTDDLLAVEQLQIGASPGAGVYLLPAWIHSFRDRYPHLSINLKTAPSPTIIQAIISGELKIAIIEGELADEPVWSVPLWDEEIVVVMSAQHPWRRRQTIDLAELAGENLIVREAGSLTRAWETKVLAESGIWPSIIAEFDSPAAIKQAVAAGVGVALLPHFAVEAEAGAQRLHKARLSSGPLSRTLKLIGAANIIAEPPAQAFISHLSREFPHLLVQVLGKSDNLKVPVELFQPESASRTL